LNSIFENAFVTDTKKRQKVEKVKAEVEALEDLLGKGIDEQIKPLVVALRMHDIPTIMSCEGHFDYGCSYPWVDIDTPIDDLAVDKLFRFLIKFYSKRYVREDIRLSLVFFPDPSVRLQTSGSSTVSLSKKEIALKKMKDYREEMNSFAEFLFNEFSESGKE